jgi:hypothetical protein
MSNEFLSMDEDDILDRTFEIHNKKLTEIV